MRARHGGHGPPRGRAARPRRGSPPAAGPDPGDGVGAAVGPVPSGVPWRSRCPAPPARCRPRRWAGGTVHMEAGLRPAHPWAWPPSRRASTAGSGGPAEAVGPVADRAVAEWRRTGWRTYHWEPWFAGLGGGARAMVLAEASSWATALWSRTEWPRLGPRAVGRTRRPVGVRRPATGAAPGTVRAPGRTSAGRPVGGPSGGRHGPGVGGRRCARGRAGPRSWPSWPWSPPCGRRPDRCPPGCSACGPNRRTPVVEIDEELLAGAAGRRRRRAVAAANAGRRGGR